jgi:hypothetical protein
MEFSGGATGSFGWRRRSSEARRGAGNQPDQHEAQREEEDSLNPELGIRDGEGLVDARAEDDSLERAQNQDHGDSVDDPPILHGILPRERREDSDPEHERAQHPQHVVELRSEVHRGAVGEPAGRLDETGRELWDTAQNQVRDTDHREHDLEYERSVHVVSSQGPGLRPALGVV